MRFIALDTETTGLRVEEGHKIIEIGCVELYDNVVLDNVFHTYINPEREVDQGAFKVHGLSNHFLQDKKTFDQIHASFIDFIGDATLVIHNAKFDMGFLNAELQRIGVDKITNQVIDTLALARKHIRGTRYNLDALCKKFNVDNSMRHKHGALVDASLLAKVFLHLRKAIKVEQSKNRTMNLEESNEIQNNTGERKMRHYYASAEEIKRHHEVVDQKIKNPLWYEMCLNDWSDSNGS